MKKGNNIELTKNIFDLSIPVVAIDIVIFTIYKDKLSVVLTTRLKDPEKWKYIIPGWIARRWFSLEENFDAILLNKTWIKNIYKEQLYTFWDPKRDSRGHIISISYYALVNKDSFLENVDFTRVNIVEYSKLNTIKLGFDHKKIIEYAKQRLNYKLEYTNIAKNILPKNFTFYQLQNVYEVVLWEKLDKRNFRKKINSLKIIKEIWKMDKTSSNRPAKLYEFIDKELKIVEIL